MKPISLINNKGGVLKTTTTANLAYTTAKKGKRVLVIDTDQQGSLSKSFGLKSKDIEGKTLASLITKSAQVHEVAKQIGDLDLFVIPADMELLVIDAQRGATISIKDMKDTFKMIKRWAEQNDFDFIFLDSTPTFTIFTSVMLDIIDDIYIPSKLDLASYDGFKSLYNEFVKADHQDKIKGIVFTAVLARSLAQEDARIAFEKASKQTKVKLLDTFISSSTQEEKYKQANMLPISASAKNVKLKQQYLALAREIGVI